jgi:hypothetical protein
MRIASQKVINSARGATCALRFPNICGGDPATTVWAHLNGGRFGKGMGIKAHDILGAHACFQCHAYLDTGHGTHPLISSETLLECVLGGVTETWVRLITAGIVIVPQDKVTPMLDRPVKPHKERGARAKVLSNPDRKIPSRPMRRKETTP